MTKANLSLPICSIPELLKWKADDDGTSDIPSRISSDPVSVNKVDSKVLLCHDMKGGYLADRFNDGTTDTSEDGFGYSYWHWMNIDVFVYFSHKLVTIPPQSWIFCSKTNGVQILGTFITEFDEGLEIWKTYLSSEAAIDAVIDQLVAIALHYNFDGWLLNIENPVPAYVSLVHRLVSELTRKMHDKMPGSVVMWYDSIIDPNGALQWQDELNVRNIKYFEEADSIFLNYTWNWSKLVRSRKQASIYDRKKDVFVGVDVFGRNCYGGGGFNTIAAVRKALDATLSVAIFAFGWVFECLPANKFIYNQQLFCNMLNGSITNNKCYKCPFNTSFSVGYGHFLSYADTEKSFKFPWYNLKFQTPCHFLEFNSSLNLALSECAYVGSSTLEVSLPPVDDSNFAGIKLFRLDLGCSSKYFLAIASRFRYSIGRTAIFLDLLDENSTTIHSCRLSNSSNWQITNSPFSTDRQFCTLYLRILIDSETKHDIGMLPFLEIGYIGVNYNNNDADQWVHNFFCDINSMALSKH